MKKLFFLAAVALAAVLSCTKPEDKGGSASDGVTATKIAFAQKSYTVVAGETVTLKLVAEPENASLKGVEFSSNHEDIATVNADAVVTAVSEGSATITAKLGKLKATAKVKVEAVPVPATGIKVDKESVTVGVGKTVTVVASLLPENTTDQLSATWKSADETVATVDGGVIRGVKQGSTKVTVSQGEFKAEVAVTVEAGSIHDRSADWKATATSRWQASYYGSPTAVTDVVLEKCDASRFFFHVLDAEENFDLDAAQKLVEDEIARLSENEQDPLSLFSTSVPQTVTVRRTGAVTAYVLSYTDDLQFNDEFAVFSFNVEDPEPVHATALKLSKTSLELIEGRNTMLSVSVEPDGVTDQLTMEWKSSDESVVTLTQSYTDRYIGVTAVAQGKATVTVSSGDLSATCEVTVTKDNTEYKDRSADWTISVRKEESGYGSSYYVTLETCDAPYHAAYVFEAGKDVQSGISDVIEQVEMYRGYGEEYLEWILSSKVPDDGIYAYYETGVIVVLGYDADKNFTGEYAYHTYDVSQAGDNPGGGDDPQPGTEGNVVSLNGEYFHVDWDSDDHLQPELTMEAWVNSSSFSGGKDNIYTVMGAEGMILLRFEGNKLNLVYGGEPRDNNPKEYQERKVSYNTSFETGKWYHIAATYVSGGAVKLYVNGEQVGSGEAVERDLDLNGVEASYELPFEFYVGVSANNRFFKGSLAYLRVWDYARSQQQIQDNMKVADPEDEGYNLLASWKFTEGSGNTIADSASIYNLKAISKGSDSATLNWIEGTLPF